MSRTSPAPGTTTGPAPLVRRTSNNNGGAVAVNIGSSGADLEDGVGLLNNSPVLEERRSASRIQFVRRVAVVAGAAVVISLSLVALTTVFLPAVRGAPIPATGEPRIYERAAVASEVPVCSSIGKDLLKAGGSAVDAAIGTALCVGSIHSFASGIGGGGFMLVRASNGSAQVIDFREVAPRGISESLFAGDNKRAQIGGLAVGVPGELRGFEAAHRAYGKLAWADVIAPVAALNEGGFRVNEVLAGRLASNRDWILASPAWRDVFAPSGTLVVAGDVVKRTALAKTLRAVAKEGARAFYEGPIAKALVEAAQAERGVISEADFAGYTPELRQPATAWYKGRKIMSAGAPASGHVLIYMLNILERYSFREGPNALDYHRIVEAMRFGFARRSELGDPAFLELRERLGQIISKEEAAAARRNISDTTSFPPSHYAPKYENAPSHGTTHISVVDASGMAVAVTTTVNLIFGSRILEPSTGVILNNQMDDFSYRNFTNFFGLPPSPSNYVAPLKRPMSSTSPTIVEQDGALALVVGGSGGSRIISSVFQTIVNFIDFEWPVTRAVVAPRLHDQLFPDLLEVEEGFPEVVARDLELNKHHKLKRLPTGTHESVVQAIARTADGKLEAVADYRKGGEPDGY
ncbi:hypothetical protein H9P43_002549 [Blastocladiella emersonii ATCC 22665]|nr:hypothetical protein H9P43_002549 [Blastocladiella emersonii ATCC 22665]